MKDQRTGLDPRVEGDHVKMMESPDLWPHQWVLPVKRPRPAELADEPPDLNLSHDSELGLMFVHPELSRWTVYRLNMLQAAMFAAASGQVVGGTVFYDYADAQGVCDAGWRVD